MHKKVENFLLKMGELSSLFGFSHVLGRIYGLLYLSPVPLSLDEIKDELAVSKATVSLSIRELLKWGLVQRIWKAGTRKDYYEAEADFLKIFNTRLVDALLRRVRVFEEGAVQEPGDRPAGEISKEYNDFIQKRLGEIKKISGLIKGALVAVKNAEGHSLMNKMLMNYLKSKI
jgi:DNA-binding transcriptional regulator GbsR (MarR family)